MEHKLFKKLFSMLLVVAMVLSMCPTFVFADGTEPEALNLDPDGNGCPHCEGEIEWITFDKATHLDANRNFKAGGHYKLTADMSLSASTSSDPTVSTADLIVPEGMDVCFDLNGKTISVTNFKDDKAASNSTPYTPGRYSRAFTNAGTLSILDSVGGGTIKNGRIGSRNAKTYGYGGNIYNTGTLNLYSGTVTGGIAYARVYNAAALGGNIANSDGSTFNMYGGTISDGRITSSSFNYDKDTDHAHQGGGNLYSAGTVNIFGGTISGGTLGGTYSRKNAATRVYEFYAKGGNIFMHAGEFNMTGGTITEGKITRVMNFYTSGNQGPAAGYGYGGNLYAINTNVSISNATITNGSVTHAVKGEYNTTGLYAAQAYAYGGNIYVDGDDDKTKVTITDSVITGGVCNASADYYTPSDANSHGKGLYINNFGGNIYLKEVARTTIDGNTKISDGVCYGAPTTTDKTHQGGGGNIWSNRILDIKGNTLVSGGTGTEVAGGSICLHNYSNCTVSENAKVIGGVGNENSGGGNFYITGGKAYLTIKDNAEVSGGSARGGGNIYANDNSHVTIAGGTIKDGIATWTGSETYWAGGNILSFNGATVTITGGVISGGTAGKFFNSVGIRGKATLNILGGQILGTEAENDLPLIGELSPDDGYGVSIYNGTIAEDPTAYMADCACYEMGANGEYKVWHVGATAELVSCTKSNCAYTANTIEVDPDNTPDAADKHEYNEDGICTICGVKAIARVNFTDGTVKHYSSIIPALQAANGTGATVTALRNTETKWYTYFQTYGTRLKNVTLATENGVQMYDTSLNSGQKVYMENVTFAPGIDYKMTGYLHAYGTINIYGTVFINMMNIAGDMNIYGDQGATLTTNRNTWISTKCAINIYGGNDDELDWNANILDTGSYSLTIEGSGKLYLENAKVSFAGIDLDAEGSGTLEMVDSYIEIRNEGSSFTDVYSMTIRGKGNVIMKGESTLDLVGSASIADTAKVTMSADSTFKTTTADFQNIKIVAAEGVDGCIYYTEGVYAVADHNFGEYTSNGDATCTADGTKSATCSNCQAKDTVTDAGSKLGHAYPDAWTDAQDGANHKKVCANDATHVITEAHTMGQWVNGTKSCTACGYTENCNHAEYDLVGAESATCLKPGYTGDKVCKTCGHTFEKGSAINQKEHEYGDDNICDNGCGKTKCENNNCVPGTPVIENNVAPDCENAGSYETVIYCTVCGEELSRVKTDVDALGHTNGAPVTENEKAPDCVNPGSYDTVVYCTVCGEELSRVTTPVDALGHTYTYTSNNDKKTHTIGCEKGDYSEVVDCADENGDKFCDLCGQKLIDPKFTVDGVEVETLDEALAAAQNGSVIKLLDNLVLTERLTLDKELRIDLEGYSITGAFEDAFGMIYVKKGATVTFVDGLIENTADVAIGNYGYVIVATDATVKGYGAGIYNFYYQADYYGGSRVSGTVNAIWNSGELVISEDAVVDYLDNSGYAVVYGTVAEIYAQDGSDAPGVFNGNKLIISDVAKVDTITVPEDYKLVEVEPYIYKVVAKEYTISVNGTKYESFAEGWANITDGAVVVLLADLDLSEILTIDKAITLDGNGHTLTSTAARAINIETTGAVTIQNLTIKAGERAINIINKASTVELNNVTATAKNNAVMIATSAGAVKLTINNSDLTGLAVVNVAGAGAVVAINNTVITNVDATAAENYGAITVWSSAEAANVTVNGGDIIVGDDSREAYVFPADATIEGVEDVGYIVATIGDAGFETLEAAIKEAKAGQTIKLIRDITASQIITIDKAITLDGNGKKLTSTAARAINIDTTGKVVINDLTINAGERAINIINKASTVELNNVTATANNNAIMIATSAGAVKLTVNNSDLTGLAVVNVAGAGAQVAINNTVITNVDATSAENYGAITVYKTAEKATITVAGGKINVADDSREAYVFPANAAVEGVADVGYIVAMVGDAGFESLQEAIDEAAAGDTIELVRNVVLTERVTVGKKITIDLNGLSITGAFEDAYGMIYVKKGAELIVKNGLIENAADVAIGNYGKVVIEASATVNGNAGLYNFYYTADYYGEAVVNGKVNAIWNSGKLTVAEGAEVAYLDNSGAAVINGAVAEIYAQDGADAPAVPNAGTLTIADTSKVTLAEGFILLEVAEGVYKVHAHAHDSEYFAATNTENAYTVYTCVCGDTYTIVEEGTMLHFAINETTGESYADLQAALNAAAKGETVKLLKDTEAEDIYIGAGKTLDLNGKKLTVTSSVSASFSTTHIIDSSNSQGLLIVDGADVAINSKNEQLPVWTAEGVKFVEIAYNQKLETVSSDANAVKYRFYFVKDADSALFGLIEENMNSLTIRIKVNYTTASGMNAYQYFELTETLVQQYLDKDGTVDLILRGAAGLQNLRFTAEIVSTAPNGTSVVIGSTPLSV